MGTDEIIGNTIGIGLAGAFTMGAIDFIDKDKKQKEIRQGVKGLTGAALISNMRGLF